MEMAGMAGRERPVLGAGAAPTSMGRVTITAGGWAAGGEGAGAMGAGEVAAVADEGAGGAAAVPEASGALGGVAGRAAVLAAGVGAGAEFAFAGLTSGAVMRCADFVDGALPFCAGAPGGWGEAPGPRPSFGGRCIDGASSPVLVDAASVSPFGGLPEKSLEKTLIAEHQP
jgi:hypothetical protein